MAAPRRSRRRKKSSRQRYVLIAAALALTVVGFFIGFRMAQPPPPPDFEALRRAGESAGPEATSVPDPSSTAGRGEASSRASESKGRASDGPPMERGAAGDGAAAGQSGDAGGGTSQASPAPVVLERQPAPGANGKPRIAIVIDDLGRSIADVEALGRFGVPLTYAVLPFETRTPEVVALLRGRGQEIFLHLPMEAKGKANPGPGALLMAMSRQELRKATTEALEAVPGAVGANNHMGSAMAADQRAMSTVLGALQERGLVFLDSRTSADSLGYSLARQLGMRAGERQVFLDTEKDRAFIRQQFQVLLAQARKRGGAIAIAHPYDETLEILAVEVPKARELGFEFVPATQLFED